MKYETSKKNITIKRRIDPDDRLIHFIRHNCNKRRYIWNKFVEIYHAEGERFDAGKTRHELIADDINQLKSDLTDDTIKEMYCADVVKSVYRDIKSTLRQMKTIYEKTGKVSKLGFTEYDPFRRAFRVEARNTMHKKYGTARGKVHFKNVSKLEFRASYNYVNNRFNVTLMEPISDEYDADSHQFITYDKYGQHKRYSFCHNDIKDIVFMEELGKFYIMIICRITCYNRKDEYEMRKDHAGIDLGIHNPVTLYDGTRAMTMRFSESRMAKINHYEKRCSRLESAMDKKYSINKAKGIDPHSKRYRKLHRRFRRYWKRVVSLRQNWRFELANKITTTYKNIVVDEMITPDNSNLNVNSKFKKMLNRLNREHAMYDFMEVLKHDAVKNCCNYIISLPGTTRTCSICGHVNDELPLSERILTCAKCGAKIDRDTNASMNCYDFCVKFTKNNKVVQLH